LCATGVTVAAGAGVEAGVDAGSLPIFLLTSSKFSTKSGTSSSPSLSAAPVLVTPNLSPY